MSVFIPHRIYTIYLYPSMYTYTYTCLVRIDMGVNVLGQIHTNKHSMRSLITSATTYPTFQITIK